MFRDKVMETFVKKVKTKLRRLNTNIKDSVIDKAVASISTVSRIIDHDLECMGMPTHELHSSNDYVGDHNRKKIQKEIEILDPFSYTSSQKKLVDQPRGLSPFSGLTEEKLERFVVRTKHNFVRNNVPRLKM